MAVCPKGMVPLPRFCAFLGLVLLFSRCTPSSPSPEEVRYFVVGAEFRSQDPACICGLDTVLPGCAIETSFLLAAQDERSRPADSVFPKLAGRILEAEITPDTDPTTRLASFPVTIQGERAIGIWNTFSLEEGRSLFPGVRTHLGISLTLPNGEKQRDPEGVNFAQPPTDSTPAFVCAYWMDGNRNPLSSSSPVRPSGEAARLFAPMSTNEELYLSLWESDVFDPDDPIASGVPPQELSPDRKTAYWFVIPRGGNDPQGGIKDDCRYAFGVVITHYTEDRSTGATVDNLTSFSWSNGCQGE